MTCPNLQGRLQCRDIYVNFRLLWVPEFRVQSFFSYSVVSVSPLVSEKSSGIQDNFHFERVDILQGPVEVCPEIYEQLALYVWTGQVV